MLVQGKIWALYIHKEINGRRLEKYSFVAQIMVDGTNTKYYLRIAIYHLLIDRVTCIRKLTQYSTRPLPTPCHELYRVSLAQANAKRNAPLSMRP
jgi:hypothetical protein